MFKQLVSRIKEDDNPRLHRVPFFFMWIATYGLGWFVIRLYERFVYGPNVCDILHVLAGDSYIPHEKWCREDVLPGLILAIILSISQTWLLKQRYGYVPKFWKFATFTGAFIAGFGHPRIGTVEFIGYINSMIKSIFLIDLFVWFAVLSLFQAVVMFRVNRQAWQIAFVGILAGLSACAINYFSLAGDQSSAKIGLIAGLMIQSIGAGLVMIRLMAEPRAGIILKRDETEKSKNYISDGIRPITFIALWIGAYYVSCNLLVFLHEFHRVTTSMALFNDFTRWIVSAMRLGWTFDIIFYITFGLILGIAQKWLMQKYYKIHVRRWILFTTIGWFLAGLCSKHYSLYPHQDAWRMVYFAIPVLFQTLPMIRTLKSGWLWIAGGFFAGVVAMFTPGHIYYGGYDYFAYLMGGLVLSLSTALIFLFLQKNYSNGSHKLKRIEDDT